MNGTVRPVSIGKAIFLGLITFGIYYYILIYRTSHDVHADKPGGNSAWKVLFWLSFFTAGITMIVLFFLNVAQANNLRRLAGMPNSNGGTLALIFMFIPGLNIAAPFLWASQVNELANVPGPRGNAGGRPVAA